MTSRILPFVEQPCASTCQSAAVAQMIGTTDVAQVRRDLVAMGVAGDPWVMGRYLRDRVQSYRFMDNASLNDCRRVLGEGFVCITHGWFTRSGHVISVKGVEPDPATLSYRLICDDPWYEFDFLSWSYTRRSGDNVRYSSWGMYAACVAAHNVSSARALFRRGELDSNRPGMWLHIIKN